MCQLHVYSCKRYLTILTPVFLCDFLIYSYMQYHMINIYFYLYQVKYSIYSLVHKYAYCQILVWLW